MAGGGGLGQWVLGLCAGWWAHVSSAALNPPLVLHQSSPRDPPRRYEETLAWLWPTGEQPRDWLWLWPRGDSPGTEPSSPGRAVVAQDSEMSLELGWVSQLSSSATHKCSFSLGHQLTSVFPLLSLLGSPQSPGYLRFAKCARKAWCLGWSVSTAGEHTEQPGTGLSTACSNSCLLLWCTCSSGIVFSVLLTRQRDALAQLTLEIGSLTREWTKLVSLPQASTSSWANHVVGAGSLNNSQDIDFCFSLSLVSPEHWDFTTSLLLAESQWK